MPIGRYFLSVGTALLAVLFLADACFPNSQPDALGRSGRNLDKSIIRITSTKKWPERIDFDTHLPTVVTTGSSNDRQHRLYDCEKTLNDGRRHK